ncbi:DUF5947 family protein [Streptomyces sp. JJ66]|uniref:DUF5947 family protein n=1 Tax=Streptomyces sp. JJ66 TaxID=2803843 RepID=UPI0027E2B865|nr:DUF5947 family protein [Streptomyces sp. JJ66]
MTAPASRLRAVAHRAAARDPRHAEAAGERCDLCAQPLDEAHRHLLDLLSDEVSCACRACALLFDRQAAGGAHYRLLPRRRLRLPDDTIDDALWAGLGLPVDLVFLTRHAASGEVTARYPSPLGTLRAHPDAGVWHEVTAKHPALADLADDVEALLVHRARDRREHWLLPLDDCYRLAALVRAHWKGLSGGQEVWQRVDGFFAELTELTELSAPATGAATDPGGAPHHNRTQQEASWASP